MIGKIIGTGAYVPDKVWDNHDIAKVVDTNDEWIRERTGVVRRHIADQDTTVSMAVKAARKALENAETEADAIDMILVSTLSSNVLVPGTACEVQRMIGAKNAVCFDLNAACTGFLFACNTVQMYMQAGMCKKALIIGAEKLSDLVDWSDRSTCILFGDGAGAAVLEAVDGDPLPMVMHSNGEKGEVLSCSSRLDPLHSDGNFYVQMNGQEVFQFAVRKVPEVIQEALEKSDWTIGDVDCFVLHQANKRIIQSISKRLKVNLEKFPMNLMEYGNTSSASIPILLDELNRSGVLKEGMKIVLAGFGGGLSWGASLLEW